jgi:glutathione S-transferase
VPGIAAAMSNLLTLYYSPGACSLVPHIALEEARADFAPRRVMLADGEHRTPEFLKINPHARVPALGVGGEVITENVAILNYLARRFGAPGTVPPDDALAAARCNELLSWFASSVHIGFAQLWRPERFSQDAGLHPAIVEGARPILAGYFAEIEELVGEEWAVEGQFTAADSYLLTFYRWGKRIGHEMAAYPRWGGLAERAVQRPAVERALATEGFTPDAFLHPA